MKKVMVVTDSSTTIPAALVEQLGIKIVPLVLNVNGRSYHDGFDITPDEFYRRQKHYEIPLPGNSTVSSCS